MQSGREQGPPLAKEKIEVSNFKWLLARVVRRAIFLIFLSVFPWPCSGNLARATGAVPTRAAGQEDFYQLSLSKVVRRVSADGRVDYIVAWQADSERPTREVDMPILGGNFRIVRPMPGGHWATVAEGNAARASGDIVEGIAWAASDFGQQADSFGVPNAALTVEGNLFPRPMVGDYVVPVEKIVISKPRINPKVTLSVAGLFDGEELSEIGRNKIDSEMEKFSKAQGRLLVEVHAARPGDRNLLLYETQLRANLIAQHIATRTGLDRDKIVALGFGSDRLQAGMRPVGKWPNITANVSDYVELRIVPEGH